MHPDPTLPPSRDGDQSPIQTASQPSGPWDQDSAPSTTPSSPSHFTDAESEPRPSSSSSSSEYPASHPAAASAPLFWGYPPSILTRDAAPWPGATFLILHQPSGRALALVRGQPRLVAASEVADPSATLPGDCSWHWGCVESSGGWLGFRNLATGVYIGHNIKMEMVATAGSHAGWEGFCARRHPDGGYLLLHPHWWSLLQIVIGEDGCSIVAAERGGTLWEFVKV
ncbi:hypothetical protein B0T25DRAFT_197666 [Lasiosphaeria hispida]|uniref:Uncharacterized protein n=1 Tax=Lasiosphaeria hispida TaxID=260671 RepID=A0AAJ0ME14_9PEZI|nr:hypothetical protein B0T25DRAFT_197666 [Lasiosphaeria hispida]